MFLKVPLAGLTLNKSSKTYMENHIQLHSTHLVLNIFPFELFPELLNKEIDRKCLEEGAYSYFKTHYDIFKKFGV